MSASFEDDGPFSETSVSEHTHDCTLCCDHWQCNDEMCEDSWQDRQHSWAPSKRICPLCEEE